MRCPAPYWIAAGFIVVAGLSSSTAQQLPERTARGNLTVTATIESSVGIVINVDGHEHIVTANTVDTVAGASRIKYVQLSPAQKDQPNHPVEPGKRNHQQTRTGN